MASKAALLISLNILFFTLVSSTSAPNPSPSTPADPIESTNAPNPSPSTPDDTIDSGNCSADPFNFKVCALTSWVHLPYWNPCCSLTAGLEDAGIAACLCSASKTKFLGFSFHIPLNYKYILSTCGEGTLKNFVCV
ncbi:hypothetical protein Lal_00042478 [Lupinus albus]|uniref:Putative bifunctional inhibitor/plant lipid transfer protein/seed storage helical n=1 Tax=Lupinus albus TaxID=3870 RepID=A0A6A4PCK5_LUPAL|nr:putative bifunctional inhibitor/plant lipid transfer protein/seed storage helical [Lupinus albus]KAE9597699.1 putative bifunctional inhibitor/plant lipid transfer protein/seed storage helical [Lupinus albus]KAF1855022.1 hypothetical protein Lal_00042463 [Lupinus albus]KAF1874043.1 hypothetical protein Lal_00041485 [Lupinus albus]KAF1874077.1 hypothetical protein Lal_00042477 [Lupinus albus]